MYSSNMLLSEIFQIEKKSGNVIEKIIFCTVINVDNKSYLSISLNYQKCVGINLN